MNLAEDGRASRVSQRSRATTPTPTITSTASGHPQTGNRTTTIRTNVNANTNQTPWPSFAQKCLYDTLTMALFSLSLFTGLSVTTAAMFNDAVVAPDEPVKAKWYVSFNLSVIYGLGLLVYSIGGMVMNCTRRLPGEIWQVWATSGGLSLLGFIRVWLMSPEPAVTEVTRDMER